MYLRDHEVLEVEKFEMFFVFVGIQDRRGVYATKIGLIGPCRGEFRGQTHRRGPHPRDRDHRRDHVQRGTEAQGSERPS